jgi:hypothetical protein
MEVLQSWWGYEGTQKRTWLCFSGISPADVKCPLTLRGQGGEKKLWQYMKRSLRSETSREMAEWLVAQSRLANEKLTHG